MTFRNPKTLRILAALLAAFHLLAAGRALVPDLCNSQKAFAAGMACESVNACCATSSGPAERDADDRIGAKQEKLPPCAFCHLVCAHNTPSAYAPLPKAPIIATTAAGLATAHLVGWQLPETNIGRDPPRRAHS